MVGQKFFVVNPRTHKTVDNAYPSRCLATQKWLQLGGVPQGWRIEDQDGLRVDPVYTYAIVQGGRVVERGLSYDRAAELVPCGGGSMIVDSGTDEFAIGREVDK